MRTQHTHPSGDLVSPNETVHQPVLLQSVLNGLEIRPSDVVLDATLGGGGHARALAEHLTKEGMLIGIDADSAALIRAKHALDGVKPSVKLFNGNFRDATRFVHEAGVTKINKALFDLGFSSDQIERTGRGFSFMRDEPLLMTLNDTIGEDTLTARQIVNHWAEETIADILYGWGDERYSRRIAKAIVTARREASIDTTNQLVAIIEQAVPRAYAHGRTHPATRTFQALRIAVNDEIGAITDGLNSVQKLMSAEGRIAVITFHSIEDRLVKNIFRDWHKAGIGTIITKKPIVPTYEEQQNNRRARSAKLRIISFS